MRSNDVVNLSIDGVSDSDEQNLKLKAISSVFIVVTIVVAILGGESCFYPVMALLSGFMCREWIDLRNNATTQIVHKGCAPAILFRLGVATLVIAMFSLLQYRVFFCNSETFWEIVLVFSGGAAAIGICTSSLRNFVRFLLAFYVFLSISLLGRLYDTCGAIFVLWLFCIVWLSDTGAFLCGKKFGKRKLAPKVSPGKTWAGFWGGTIFTTLIVSLLWLFITSSVRSTLRLSILTTILSICSHLGDLIESAAKRYIGVKDIGRAIPGHGGFSDRFDSLLFVSLAAYSLRFILSTVSQGCLAISP
ncbi:MAG: phosphatidate cytidylyltransferase [Holosporales bacterium]|jgi:CDP-diglyceride synthetase|nr:phosphatidate cytidylyltransferase [Holosporales bacterium]